MKKLLSLLLISVLCVGLVGCSDTQSARIKTGSDTPNENAEPGASTDPTDEMPGAVNDGELNWDGPVDTAPSQDTQAPIEGNEIGDRCYGYDLPVINDSGLSGDTINPVTINPADPDLVTVINFWGTWCTPCKEELPYFDQIAREYDNVTVVAIHGGETNANSAYDYIAENYADSPIVFAADYTPEGGVVENGYATTLGGGSFYPYTLVLDHQGVIVETFDGMVTYEELKAAVDAAM